ncbi:MAG: response regulator [Candidatus Sumerlaeota bacterium]|nr:response regulator [Candidatus Sumerlaeota bacterium]
MDRWRILVVDDNEDTLDLIRLTLQEEYDVFTLADPTHALDALDILEPDLAILDVMMPKVSGFQLMEFMRKKPAYRAIPVVFLTAKGAIKDQKYGYSLGASLYLTKPFPPSRLQKNLKLMFENLGGTPKPKKHSLREVELQMSLLRGKGAAGEPPRGAAPEAPAKPKPEDEKKDPWID